MKWVKSLALCLTLKHARDTEPMVTTTMVCLGELDPGSLLPWSRLMSSGRKRVVLSTKPQRLQPRLLGQRVSIPHTKPKGATDTGAPAQRSPSFCSAGPKSQLVNVPRKLGFLKEVHTRIRDDTCLSCSWPRSNKPSLSLLLCLERGQTPLSASSPSWHNGSLHLLINV